MAKIPEKLLKKRNTPGVIAPPPLIYALVFGGAWLLHMRLPIKLVDYNNVQTAGYALMGLGAVIALWAFKTMRGAETPVNPYKPVTALVTSGPYRFSRNPIYLALTFIYFGLALYFNTLWAAALYPLVLIVMFFGVILREERYLLLRYGTKYLKYKVSVRRWL